ncbi:MAG: polysaccharide biosynthesis C-terminal domain-containing protein, partial [Bacteroidota bacterium]
AYRTALPIVPYLLLAYLLLGVYYNLSVWFKLTDRTLYGVWLTSLGAAVTLVLNMLLIPRIGYWGSVWATLASCATMCSFCYYLGQRHYPVPYHLWKGLGYIIGTMALVLLTRQINYSSFGQAVVINALWTLLFALSLYLLNARSKA